VLLFGLLMLTPIHASDSSIEVQPLLAQVKRLQQALEFLGQPLPAEVRKELDAIKETDAKPVAAVQKLLEPFVFATVELSKDSKDSVVKVTPHLRKVELIEQGWRVYLVKVINGSGSKGILAADSPNAKRVPTGPKGEIDKRWLGLEPFTSQPLLPNLSGLELEYRVLQIYSRDVGDRSAEVSFGFTAPKGPVDLKGAAGAMFDFITKAAIPVTFKVTEFDGNPVTASFLIRDAAGRVYPSQAKRLAPDFFFHPQIYRSTGEKVLLPAGKYTIRCSRGPESIPEEKELIVGDQPLEFKYSVARWIDPSKRGWWSGDHHIHAAGCQHYENPTEGVHPPDMLRHIMGEDLKVGCCLTWGPCFDYQKRFFTGKPDDVSKYPYLLRYDVEVSGFGSHVSGHLNLLKLKEQIFPGGDSKNHWPTLGMNTLRWAKKQGAICGPAHSASGLTRSVGRIDGGKDGPYRLPNFELPAYDGIGANEFVVQAALTVPGPDGKMVPAVDFISAMDTDRVAEWNMWYHVLNCGFRTRVSGETDFPCISGERVGMGRVYVKVQGKLDFDRWVDGIAAGRSYVSDGLMHLIDFSASVGGKEYPLGVNGSEIKLEKASRVRFVVQTAARYGNKKTTPVELIVNGYPVEKKEISCDGELRELTFETEISSSSWVAVRAFPGAHTNPIFVEVEGKPIRANKHSAEWCLQGVDQCWKMKKPSYKKEESQQAEDDYAAARKIYEKIRDESK
jgi:hypothetical protein